MTSYLLQEDGSFLLQEDGNKIILDDAESEDLRQAFPHPDNDVTISIRIALAASALGAGVWNTGKFNQAKWGPDIIWSEVATWCQGFSTTRKFQRDVGQWAAGTATLTLDNRDGRFSPSNLDGPYVVNGLTSIRPWRPVSIQATFDSVTYDMFRGYVLTWDETYDSPQFGDVQALVTVSCVDELGHLAAFKGFPETEQGFLETSGQRVHRLLDNAGHTGPRNVDNGHIRCIATTLEANTAQELGVVADSEGGALYVDVDGTVVFEDGLALIENTRSNTTQAIFGDEITDDIQYSDIVLTYTGSLVANVVSFGRETGNVVTVTNEASRALYGDLSPSGASRTDLVTVLPSQIEQLAELYLATHKDPEQIVSQVTLKPRRDLNRMMPECLGLKVRDRVRVRRHPVGGYTIAQLSFISGVSHVVNPQTNDWTTTFDLVSAEPWDDFDTSLWDVGLFDNAEFFY